MHPYRTHTCGELRAAHARAECRLSGWVFRKRDHGGVLFIDLRDNFGITQVVVRPECDFFETCRHLRLESVVTVTGQVARRSEETVNPSIPTGEIELVARDVAVLSEAEALPFALATDETQPEELRLRYRFLDLRRDKVRRNIILRSRVIAEIRRIMIEEHGFLEFQTPILTASSPEGARDFIVPSRTHPGKFYALPQAPQQFKQLLMAAGFDRYFQIAPCFRDEDARADRSPGEHYQLDMEMSFVEQDDIFLVVESVLHAVFAKFGSKPVVPPPFPRIPYSQAMLEYGTDKPDLRIPLKICDASDVFAQSGFDTFSSVVRAKGVVRAIAAPGAAAKPRSFFDKLRQYAQELGADGLAYLTLAGDSPKGPVAKFLTGDQTAKLAQRCGAGPGSVIFLLAGPEKQVGPIAGSLRVKLGEELPLCKDDSFMFCWVTDFPMYELDAETHSIQFLHNPFSMPQGGLKALTEQDPLAVLAYQYDIVCNGIEIGSGALRNYRPEIMCKAFEIAGYAREDVETRFPALLNAFRCGTPPHGGIAPGIDRIIMLLAGEQNIREVIAFPLNQRAQDLMMNAPSFVTEKQLREAHIRLRREQH